MTKDNILGMSKKTFYIICVLLVIGIIIGRGLNLFFVIGLLSSNCFTSKDF